MPAAVSVPGLGLTPKIKPKGPTFRQKAKEKCGTCGLITCCCCYSVLDAGYCGCSTDCCSRFYESLWFFVLGVLTITLSLFIIIFSTVMPLYEVVSEIKIESVKYVLTIGLQDLELRYSTGSLKADQFDYELDLQAQDLNPASFVFLSTGEESSSLIENSSSMSKPTFLDPVSKLNFTSFCSESDTKWINQNRSASFLDNFFVSKNFLGAEKSLTLCQFQFTNLGLAMARGLVAQNPPFFKGDIITTSSPPKYNNRNEEDPSSLDFWRLVQYKSVKQLACPDRFAEMLRNLGVFNQTRIPKILFAVLFMIYAFLGSLMVYSDGEDILYTITRTGSLMETPSVPFMSFLYRKKASWKELLVLGLFTIAFFGMMVADLLAWMRLKEVVDRPGVFCPKDPVEDQRALTNSVYAVLANSASTNTSLSSSSSNTQQQFYSSGFYGDWITDLVPTPMITSILAILMCISWWLYFLYKHWLLHRDRFWTWWENYQENREKKKKARALEKMEELEYHKTGKTKTYEDKIAELEAKLADAEAMRKEDLRKAAAARKDLGKVKEEIHRKEEEKKKKIEAAMATGGGGAGGGGAKFDEITAKVRVPGGAVGDIYPRGAFVEDPKKRLAVAAAAPVSASYPGLPGGAKRAKKDKTTFFGEVNDDDSDDDFVNFKLNKNSSPHGILADRKRGDDATSIVEMPSAVPFGFQPAVIIGNNNNKNNNKKNNNEKPSAKASSGKPDSITLSSGSSGGPPKSGSSGKSTDSWTKML